MTLRFVLGCHEVTLTPAGWTRLDQVLIISPPDSEAAHTALRELEETDA